ncbi:imidazoleglycerol-phosphate dehydratase HisB [Ferroplasma acidarmanus]|uniref:Imidazoleglycerol-phosphate dehydratase n=1 Tax=Ferroplasma acidarmanus Fer1 TaxID=333146 RepID=S0AQR2_FERAC|nr:imidazoleglycerol-phosphate dehydratase HisB [Ferroplasma acidarmanus]AGO60509.1 imidazoleglycerol-phosphate dehydratase [Ferroplasma acidarmanus Fer1]
MIRETKETVIEVDIGSESTVIETGDKILDHMMRTLFFYMGRNAKIKCSYDLRHHLWEDLGITIAMELTALKGEKPVKRFGSATMPMDESLIMVSLDISRAYINFQVDFRDAEGFELNLLYEFLWALARTMPMTLHVIKFSGINSHHITENVFKALGAALGNALEGTEYTRSTKGIL